MALLWLEVSSVIKRRALRFLLGYFEDINEYFSCPEQGVWFGRCTPGVSAGCQSGKSRHDWTLWVYIRQSWAIYTRQAQKPRIKIPAQLEFTKWNFNPCHNTENDCLALCEIAALVYLCHLFYLYLVFALQLGWTAFLACSHLPSEFTRHHSLCMQDVDVFFFFTLQHLFDPAQTRKQCKAITDSSRDAAGISRSSRK